MAPETILESREKFSAKYRDLIDRAHSEPECARWKLSRENFAEALRRSAASRFGDVVPDAPKIDAYLKSLHLADLALACACAQGSEQAWEHFVANFRKDLRSGARAILQMGHASNDVRADDLADSLFAELYGVGPTGRARRTSLFEYFHGRSKLSTWLWAVLAQRYVDLLREGQRTVSYDSLDSQGSNNSNDPRPNEMAREFPRRAAPPLPDPPPDPQREVYLANLDRVLSAAICDLLPREQIILSYYYLDQLTLAEIGRILHEHESTISRQLDRTRRQLRERVNETLLKGSPAQNGFAPLPAMSPAQVDLTFEYALDDFPFDLSRALSRDPGSN